MSTKQQQIFKKIVVVNKMMTAETVDRLLAGMPDPEVAVKFLVKKGKLPEKKAGQLLALYRKQLEKSGDGGEVAEPAKPAKPASADDVFDEMLDEVAKDGPASSTSADTPADAAADKQQADATPDDATAAQPETDYGGLPPIKVDLGADDEEEEDLPLLEVDRDDEEAAPGAAPPAKAAPSAKPASVPAVAAGPATPAGPIDPTIKGILEQARELKASDVHIKSQEIPLVRVAGALRELEGQPRFDKDACRAGLLSLLDSEQRDIFERTGDLDFCYDGGEQLGRFRSNMLNQHRGTDGIFRLISTVVPSFEDLKLPPTIKKFTEYKQGIILITGPKGSGKTTTLAAMVDMINRTRPEHIITVEDPIEFVHPCKMGHVNQREVGTHTKSFSNALRAALRKAPDVIMVGEMRDLETTSLAITAAETGHLVFATLHTPDAVRTIDRVLDVFPPKEQGQVRSMVSESMRGILSQLLVPSVDGKSLELAVEIMVNTSAIGNLIREAKTFQLRGIMQTGRRLGMVLMDDSLVSLVKEGRISKDEAVALAAERKQVEEALQ